MKVVQTDEHAELRKLLEEILQEIRKANEILTIDPPRTGPGFEVQAHWCRCGGNSHPSNAYMACTVCGGLVLRKDVQPERIP